MSNYLLITLQKISVQRQTSLGAMFAYNRSDWTYGWMAAFDGFTVFYAEVNLRQLQNTYLKNDCLQTIRGNHSLLI